LLDGAGCWLGAFLSGLVVFCGSGKYLSYKMKKGFQFFLITVFVQGKAKMAGIFVFLSR
jgi:hypothetical protein